MGIPQDQSYGYILAFGLGSWGKDSVEICEIKEMNKH